MDKAQALNEFWNSFGIPAYSQETTPDDAPSKHITYSVATDSIGNAVMLNASIWDIGTKSWQWISNKTEEISNSLIQVKAIPLDTGFLYLTRGTPFVQRMSDENDSVRRIYLNVMAEYLTP